MALYLLKSYQPFRAYSNALPSLDAFPNPFQMEHLQWLLIHTVPWSLSCILVTWGCILFLLLAETFLRIGTGQNHTLIIQIEETGHNPESNWQHLLCFK